MTPFTEATELISFIFLELRLLMLSFFKVMLPILSVWAAHCDFRAQKRKGVKGVKSGET